MRQLDLHPLHSQNEMNQRHYLSVHILYDGDREIWLKIRQPIDAQIFA